MEQIKIRIKKGRIKVEVQGVKGRSCKELTADFEKSLNVISDEPTREYNEQPAGAQVKNRA